MIDEVIRKRSPRAPSIPLEAAVERALKIYDAEGRHQAPADAVAQDIGYKSANSGAAKTTLASIGYYGLLDRPKDGFLSVAKSVEEFKFAPSERMKSEILERWLRTPDVFAELLEKYSNSLPSQATIKFDLIQRGFSSESADDCISCFTQSVSYVRSLSTPAIPEKTDREPDGDSVGGGGQLGVPPLQVVTTPIAKMAGKPAGSELSPTGDLGEGYDAIPVRLSGGRKAWLTIPNAFYAADKQRLIAQIQLLLTEDDDDDL